MLGLWRKLHKSISGNALPVSIAMPDTNSVVLLIVSSAVQRFMRRARNIHNFNVIIVADL